MNRTDITRFNVSEYLDSAEMITEYLGSALDANDPALLLSAIVDVARSKVRAQGKSTERWEK